MARLTLVRLSPDGVVVLGKGDKERHAKLAASDLQSVALWLQERRGGISPEEALFTNHAGGRPSKKQIGRIVRDAARRLGVEKVHPHLLRHMMAGGYPCRPT